MKKRQLLIFVSAVTFLLLGCGETKDETPAVALPVPSVPMGIREPESYRGIDGNKETPKEEVPLGSVPWAKPMDVYTWKDEGAGSERSEEEMIETWRDREERKARYRPDKPRYHSGWEPPDFSQYEPHPVEQYLGEWMLVNYNGSFNQRQRIFFFMEDSVPGYYSGGSTGRLVFRSPDYAILDSHSGGSEQTFLDGPPLHAGDSQIIFIRSDSYIECYKKLNGPEESAPVEEAEGTGTLESTAEDEAFPYRILNPYRNEEMISQWKLDNDASAEFPGIGISPNLIRELSNLEDRPLDRFLGEWKLENNDDNYFHIFFEDSIYGYFMERYGSFETGHLHFTPENDTVLLIPHNGGDDPSIIIPRSGRLIRSIFGGNPAERDDGRFTISLIGFELYVDVYWRVNHEGEVIERIEPPEIDAAEPEMEESDAAREIGLKEQGADEPGAATETGAVETAENHEAGAVQPEDETDGLPESGGDIGGEDGETETPQNE